MGGEAVSAMQDWDSEMDAARALAPTSIDGMLYNGVDYAAMRRTHARELTTARQAAELRYARPAEQGEDRAAEYHAELARIQSAHGAWLRERGEAVVERGTRKRRPTMTAL